jgi:hypothetical protein
MALGVILLMAIRLNMARRVGSDIAWKTSLRKFIVQLFDCKYMRNHLTAQIFFSTKARKGVAV